MKISIIHPSRNRAEKAHQAILQWLAASSKKVEIQYILTLDNDDNQLSEYMQWLNKLESESTQPNFTVSHIRGVSDYIVAAVNRGAKIAKGDILIFMADDFEAPSNWDLDIVSVIFDTIQNNKELSYRVGDVTLGRNAQKVALLVSDNCNTAYNLLTLPIITKEFYQEFGYFFHPEFKSMWCDNFIYEQAKRNGYLVDARQIVFTHRHYTNVNAEFRSEIDETYIRSNNMYNEGKVTFDKLMALNNWN
jgi:glycosyltransferase involved in cell wall biosynthesis